MTLFTLLHFAYFPMLLFPVCGQEVIANLKSNSLGELRSCSTSVKHLLYASTALNPGNTKMSKTSSQSSKRSQCFKAARHMNK